MARFLKGNYRLPRGKSKKISVTRKKAGKNLTEQFEESALARLGGSICFVTKKNMFLWRGEQNEETGQGAH
jgi:hypothetical protein